MICILLFFTLIGFSKASAQRVAYVNTDYVLEKLPQYRSAQDQLDQLTKKWRRKIQQRVKEIDKLYDKYKAEKVLLPEEEKQQLQEKITQKEEALEKYKQDKFGDEGALFQKRKELIKPIQDRVFDAVQKLAEEQSLDMIFDKAGATTMLYTNARYDRSDKVLELMGIDPDKQSEDDNGSSSQQQDRTAPEMDESEKGMEDRERDR
jgi:outer membrane protein